WLEPSVMVPTLFGAVVVVAVPLLAQPLIAERDLRLRTHTGALSRFYLDSLLGLVAIRAHSAERAIRHEHETMLQRWSRAALELQRALITLETWQTFVAVVFVGWIALVQTSSGAELSPLLVFWALSLPVIGQEIALFTRQFATQRNLAI